MDDGRSERSQKKIRQSLPASVLAMAAIAALAALATSAISATSAIGCAAENEAPPADPEAETARLHDLFERYFEENLERSPIQATAIGDSRYNDRLPNFLSAEYRAEQDAFEKRWLEEIQGVSRDALSGQDRLSYDIFVYERETALEGTRFPDHLVPINQFFSFPSFFAQLGSGGSIQPFATEKDYRDFLGRIDGMAVLLDQAIENMREGIETGVVQPRVLMLKVIPQLEAHIVDEATRSVFYRPLNSLPEDLAEGVGEELTAAYTAAIEEKIVPSFTRLRDFVRDEYIPACRDSVALSDMPDGDAWYAFRVKTQTTTAMTPEEIHQFGLDEVARITGEMEQVAREVGFEGTLQDFFAYLKENDEFYFDTADDLVTGYMDLQDKVNELVPKMFDVQPKADYEVRPVPEFMAAASAGAFYQPATPDGSRPGVFFVNTHNLRAQPKFGMETLSIHEASPGHHFQISIAQEIEELPRFRRFGGETAFAEGWALYAESLGKELGLFTDPYQYYGRLADEMLRAMRLVVDTGLHAKGWSREQAIDYMLEHSSMAESDVVAEVERYVAIAGQALAYKVGQRVISGLRARAEEELADAFDIKVFHRAVLVDGSLPMGVLETKIGEWLAEGES